MSVRKLSAAAAVALAWTASGCGSPAGNDAEPDANVVAPAPSNQLNVAMPNLSETAPKQAALPCPQEPGVTCTGPLIIRAEGFNLLAEDRYAVLQGTLVFESRTGGPVRVAILQEPVSALLDRGGVLQSSYQDALGIETCGSDGPGCLRDNPGRFRTIVPGDSPLRVRTGMRASQDPATRATMPTVQTAEISFQVHAVEGTGTGETLSIAIPGVPLRNQIAP